MQTPPATAPLVLRLLGDVQLTWDGQPLACGSRKSLALFIYLVLVPRRHRRADLASLLWGTRDTDAARTSLRTALQRLPEPLARVLDAQRESIGLAEGARIEIDAARFESLAASAELASLEQASQLYGGELLKGLDAEAAPGFDDWLVAERARYVQLAQGVFDRLIAGHRDTALRNSGAAAGARANALAAARRWLQVDPACEAAHRWLMQLMLDAGQREAARLQYEVCRRALAVAHGRTPSQHTRGLYEQLTEDHPAPAAAAMEPAEVVPLPSTSFVGRLDELASLQRLLVDPGCRLLTLHGLGGIGKSRLAGALLAQAAPLYRHGVAWVSVEQADRAGRLPQAIAAACAVDLPVGGEPGDAICALLRSQHRLIVLDAFEGLAADDGAVELLLKLLRAAPRVQWVLTSRAVLGLQEEWVYDVPGLNFPEADSAAPSAEYAAVELFAQRARQAYLGFSLAAEWSHVVRLCKFTGGLPLALELAAAWLRTMPCGDLVRAFEAALSARQRQHSRDARHESLTAVVQTSWDLLGADEQRALAALSVFAGGFTPQSAQAVADSSLRGISLLIDKALIARRASGRLDLHPVVRTFCKAELHKELQRQRAVERAHAAYYAALLARCRAYLDGPDEEAAQAELVAELHNIVTAADRWIEAGDNIELIAEPLCRLLVALGRSREARAYADRFLAAGLAPATAAYVLALRGQASAALNEFASARADFDRAAVQARFTEQRHARLHVDVNAVIVDLGADRAPAAGERLRACEAQLRADDDPLLWIRLRWLQGATAHAAAKPSAATQYLLEALQRAETMHAPTLVATIQSSLGLTLLMQGRSEEAEPLLRASIAALERTGRSELLRALNGLAFLLMARGEAADAVGLARRAVDLCERAGGGPGALSSLLDTLGRALWALDRLDDARQQFERAASIGGPITRDEANRNLVLVSLAQGRADEAREHLRRMLHLADESDLAYGEQSRLLCAVAIAAHTRTHAREAAGWLQTLLAIEELGDDVRQQANKLRHLLPVDTPAASVSVDTAMAQIRAFVGPS